ncbi:MAG: hypothetical protein PUD72_07055 [Oscillospiraceae bacterium]|nr:hypothetical protein [Oscillospiraceae bacterium]
MKKIISILLVLVICLSFSACNKKSVVYEGTYDEETYVQSSEISGVSFLIPKDIYSKTEPYENKDNYTAEEIGNHIFKTSDEKNFCIYQPGSFFYYVFDLDRIEGIEEQRDVSEIPGLTGTSKWIALQTRNPNTCISTNVDGNIQIIYGSYVAETLIGKNITYNSYVSILHDADTNHDYMLIVGFNNVIGDKTALEIAQEFKLVK